MAWRLYQTPTPHPIVLQQLLASDSSVSVQSMGLALVERADQLPYTDNLEAEVIERLAQVQGDADT